MPPLSFADARSAVLQRVRPRVSIESVPLQCADGRILAEDIVADRDYPPFDRSARDGYAVRAADFPGSARVTGEVRAGGAFRGTVGPAEAVEIMTGAAVPPGADAVIMVEHCTVHANTVTSQAQPATGANLVPRGSEAAQGALVLKRSTRIDYTSVSWLATTGHAHVQVFARPRVAILATGDEIIGIEETPGPHQIRDSNAYSLAAQVRRAGGDPVLLPLVPDDRKTTRLFIEDALQYDLLLLSGGVSAGKYDFVEPALVDLYAEIFFDRVLIQPGQPVVFGQVAGKFLFGLPGNPASTMVTFEVLARAAIELLAGATESSLQMPLARLAQPFRHKPGLTRFLPAKVHASEVTPVPWQGSGDVAALCSANAWLVAEPDHPEYAQGDLIGVIYR